MTRNEVYVYFDVITKLHLSNCLTLIYSLRGNDVEKGHATLRRSLSSIKFHQEGGLRLWRAGWPTGSSDEDTCVSVDQFLSEMLAAREISCIIAPIGLITG